MTYEEWITYVKRILTQYDDGALMSSHVFDAIVGMAQEVFNTDKEREAELVVEEVDPASR